MAVDDKCRSYFDSLPKEIKEKGEKFISQVKSGLYVNRHKMIYQPKPYERVCGD